MIAPPVLPPRCAARVGLVALVLAALVAGCGREPPKAPEKGPVAVTTQAIQRHDVPLTAVYVAQTQSSQAVNIQARVAGWLDKRLYVEGAVVRRGQVLFQMDAKPFQAQLDAAKAALQRNEAALQVARANLNRTKPLAQLNALSQKDLDDAQGQYEQAAAAVAQARAQVTEAELNLSYTTIRSPVDGVSSFAVVADGTYLSPSNSQLTTVSVLTPMWVNFSVSENEMERIRNEVRAGQLRLPEGGRFVVEIEMVDGNLFPYSGAITFADPSYNPTTGTFMLRATVNNPAGVLRPNQYVRVRLNGAVRPNAIVVPQRAVQQSAKGHFVWVVDKSAHAELRPVVVGDWKGEGWIIADGLNDGDQVVIDGGVRLTEGAAVKATPYVPASPPAPAAAGGTPQKGAAGVDPGRGATPLPAPYPSATPSSVAVYFPKGLASLDAAALRTLRLAAAAYVGIGTRIEVTGYADRTGNAAANVELAQKRAQAVRDELVHLGVKAQRIALVAPVAVTGSGPDDQARRVDLRVQQ
ncbi:MAG: efflux RND transporter periplasmic adaptor subunit [Burkholderiales bacterium]|nr:efflux RND transporter periplasmic adaptor subunit [Burkholderiales bacterium]